jgi:hypothetical protein
MVTAIATQAPARGHDGAGASPSAFIARLHGAILWILVFSGGFVIVEPAPYELLFVLTVVLFAVTGLTLRATQLPLALLLIVHNAGFIIATIPVIDLPDTLKWTAVSAVLSATTVFFAMVISRDTERRLDIIANAYLASAIVTSVIAVLAFFKLMPGWENFILYLRARSTFKDPNVFGPFLVLPALIVMQRIISGGLRNIVIGGAAFLLIAAGLFLSFSRGAWGNFAVSAIVMLGLMWITSRSIHQRIRLALFAILGAMTVAAVVLALLSVRDVSSLFADRAALVKDYDAGELGRFGRHVLGMLMIPEAPFGLGPIQFSKYFNYEPHNSFLDPFMNGGWLAGVTWFALMVMTLVLGLRHVFVRTPWRETYIAVYAAFIGEVGESYIIDVQHWRHYFLIIGLIWGMLTATRPAMAQARSPA